MYKIFTLKKTYKMIFSETHLILIRLLIEAERKGGEKEGKIIKVCGQRTFLRQRNRSGIGELEMQK